MTPVIYDYRDYKIDYLNKLFLKRNTYYRKMEQQVSLFDEHETNSKAQTFVIQEIVKIPFDLLEFRYGAVVFEYLVKGNILKIRYVLDPFSFVFLLEGDEQFHLVLETLDTEEATYIWHIPNRIEELQNKIRQIDKDLSTIRNEGRVAFLESRPDHFSRILHDYSDDRGGFIIWKDYLEERLI